MGDYVKRIKFEAVKDSKSFSDLRKSMSDIGFDFTSKITNNVRSIRQLQHETEELSSQYSLIEKLKGKEYAALRKELSAEIDARKKELSRLGVDEKSDSNFSDMLQSTGQWFLKGLINVFSDAWSELKTITDFSRLSSSRTRELAFTYGFTGSQAYGYTEAMSMMGFESEEDLMYATANELSEFKRLFTKYTEWHEQLGADEMSIYRQYTIESAEFQKNLKMQVVEFFMDNKDNIKKAIDIVFKVGDVLISSLGWIVDFLGGDNNTASERAAAFSEAANNYQIRNTTNTTKNNNVFNNTFNLYGPNSSSDIGMIQNDQVQAAFGGAY